MAAKRWRTVTTFGQFFYGMDGAYIPQIDVEAFIIGEISGRLMAESGDKLIGESAGKLIGEAGGKLIGEEAGKLTHEIDIERD